MLLNSIQLKNFRQYRGDQKVVFSSDETQNVTVILGDNTSGKTTLVQAFNWALYGISSFSTKDFLLNMDVAKEMNISDTQEVEVEVCLNHDNTDYTITRTQAYVCDSKGVVRPTPSKPRVSYKVQDGQMETMRSSAIEGTINKILPYDLSGYFFFDGERIENISSKQDVTESVKGLLGLSVLDNAIKHLDPSKKNSVIGKFKSSLDHAGNQKAAEALQRVQSEQDRLLVIGKDLETVRGQINYYDQRREQLGDIIRDNRPTRELQQRKLELEKSISVEGSALESGYGRFLSDFNTNPSLFFAKPLMSRAINLLKGAKIHDKGVPNMNATSIDFIINRGRCICGSEVCNGNEAHSNLLEEREYLPPQSIGTMIRTFNDQIATYNSASRSFNSNIRRSYEDIYRSKTRIQDWEEEVESISGKIQGAANVQKYELELRDVNLRLKEFNQKKEKLIADESVCKSEIVRYQKIHDSLIAVSEKNIQIMSYSRYAEAVYQWVKETYELKENEIRELLETKVNSIFSRMYHGKRKVIIDNKYRVSLLTAYADEEIKTDESRGLETVKNFAFIAGLVDLAREKINSNTGEAELALSTEPYPLVMDAPFSNADEKHVSTISKVLPEIAEQVIMVVMSKDWSFAEKVMGDRVGRKYILEKKSETLTYIKEING